MAKYGEKAKREVKKSMHEFKRGKLKSGSGQKVKSRKQAIVIGLSKARRDGGKAPSFSKADQEEKKKNGSMPVGDPNEEMEPEMEPGVAEPEAKPEEESEEVESVLTRALHISNWLPRSFKSL